MCSPDESRAAVSSIAMYLRDGDMVRLVFSLMRLSGVLSGWRLPAYRPGRALAFPHVSSPR